MPKEMTEQDWDRLKEIKRGLLMEAAKEFGLDAVNSWVARNSAEIYCIETAAACVFFQETHRFAR
jgi:hypothetical protein